MKAIGVILALTVVQLIHTTQGQAPAEVHVGGLYAVAYGNVRERASHFRLALDMINDKTDGWFDDILPSTQIRYVVDNSGCSRSVALEGAAKQGTPCMSGSTSQPVVATVGATCSGASMSAQDLLKLYKIPMVSYSATSPDLSDKTLYPYFLRTVPSDLAQGKGIATLAKHFGVKRVGVVASDGAYGIGLADQFRSQAAAESIDQPASAYKTVSKYSEVDTGAGKEAKVDLAMICKVRDLAGEGVRHVFGALQTQDAQYFAATVFQSGYLKGPEYMYYAPDSWSNNQAMQILDGDIGSWWYKPRAGTLGGYYRSSAGGDIIPLFESSTGDLESANPQSNCLKVTGTRSGASVSLGGRGTGTVSTAGGQDTITWADGEVWTRLPPPTLENLEATMLGTVGLAQSTFGPLLQNYIDTIWEPKNARYAFDTVNQDIANQFFIDNGDDLGWADGDGDRKTVHPYGPPSFDAATAVALAIHDVIEAGNDPTDGEKLLEALKKVEFEGLSGKVSFDENLDRRGSRYTLFNRRSDDYTVGLLEGDNVTFSRDVIFPGARSTAPTDGTCLLNSQITSYCSGRGTCDFGAGVCMCPVGYGGANCEVIMPAPCTASHFDFTVSKCSTDNERVGVYTYKNGSQSCCNEDNFGDLCPTGLPLPAPINVECDYVHQDSPVGQAFLALAILSIAFQLALLVAVIMYRNNPFMRRSQPTMMALSIIGAIMGIASIFVLLGKRSDETCRTVPALLTLGFTLMYASLALKMYRVHVLFNNKYMKVVTMGVRQMMFILSLVMAAELLVLLLFIFVDDLRAGFVHETVKGALIPYFECKSSGGSPIGIVLIFMKILLLLYGLVLGFRVRNAPADYQEVKVVVMGAYNTALAVIVVIPMYFYLDLDRDVRFIIVCCGILYAFNGATALVIFPKLLHILRGDQAQDASTIAQTMVSKQVSPGATAGGLATIHTSNVTTTSDTTSHYEDLIKQKDREIADLKSKLEEAAKPLLAEEPSKDEGNGAEAQE
ncbi:metabotropic glutamate receptor [Chloropicon primus]|nr:metabotropic glutamate receptor [Chloropicon primus]